MFQGRRKKDSVELRKLFEFLNVNNLFEKHGSYLKNLETAVITEERINCDHSFNIRHQILSKMNNLKFKEIKLLKSDQRHFLSCESLQRLTRNKCLYQGRI